MKHFYSCFCFFSQQTVASRGQLAPRHSSEFQRLFLEATSPPTRPQECPTNAFEIAVERKAWWRMKRILFPDKIKEKNMSSVHFKIVPEAAKRCPVMEKC